MGKGMLVGGMSNKEFSVLTGILLVVGVTVIFSLLGAPTSRLISQFGAPITAPVKADEIIVREPQPDPHQFAKVYRVQMPSRFRMLEEIDAQNAYLKDPNRGFCYFAHGSEVYPPSYYVVSFTRVDCQDWESKAP